jgi:hypothetical protein
MSKVTRANEDGIDVLWSRIQAFTRKAGPGSKHFCHARNCLVQRTVETPEDVMSRRRVNDDEPEPLTSSRSLLGNVMCIT